MKESPRYALAPGDTVTVQGLMLTGRAHSALYNMAVSRGLKPPMLVDDLRKITDVELIREPNLGGLTLQVIREALGRGPDGTWLSEQRRIASRGGGSIIVENRLQQWETVNVMGNEERKEITSRMPVNGGWLYRYTVLLGLREVAHVTMCFVPGE